MDKKNFIEVLRNPKEISENEFDDLESIVSQYPYFQTARAIIASGSKALGKYDSDKKLTTAAIYTTNRNLLKRYVFDSLDFSQINDIKVGEAVSYSSNDTDQGADLTKKKKKFIFVERKEEITERTGKGKFIDLTKKTEDDDDDYLVVSESVTTGDSIDWETKIANQEALEVPKSIKIEDENSARKIVARKPQEFSHVPPRINNDELVDEVFKNLEEYHKRKNHYTEVEQKILDLEETEAVNEAILKASEKLKINNTTENIASNKTKDELENPTTPLIKHEEYKKQEKEIKNKIEVESDVKDGDTLNKSDMKASETSVPSNIQEKSSENGPENQEKKEPLEAKETENKSTERIEIENTEIRKPISNYVEKVESKSEIQDSENDEEASKSEEDKDDTFAKMVADIKRSSASEEPPAAKAPIEVAKTKPTPTIKSGKIQKQADIIENFIKAKPKIVPIEENSNKEIKDLSIDSTNLKDGLATENLAKIFLKQGKREKAIEIYEQLILINPDKKSYFASQISKLK